MDANGRTVLPVAGGVWPRSRHATKKESLARPIKLRDGLPESRAGFDVALQPGPNELR